VVTPQENTRDPAGKIDKKIDYTGDGITSVDVITQKNEAILPAGVYARDETFELVKASVNVADGKGPVHDDYFS